MRLLTLKDDSELNLIEFIGNRIPRYAILSHTWGADSEEVTFKDAMEGTGKNKAGYQKIWFCGKQAATDGLQYFWVDTCCIDKSSSAELSEAINSMFRWYHDASKCYVYLSDVSNSGSMSSLWTWESAFQKSRWFTRGWTLQELIAPVLVEFFSVEGERLGDKKSLERQIQRITGIPPQALHGGPLSHFSINERMLWAVKRQTKREEDIAYSLLGIFGIHMPLIYGEGRKRALVRLAKEIKESLMDTSPDIPRALFLKHEDAIEEPIEQPQTPTSDAANQSSCLRELNLERKRPQDVDYIYESPSSSYSYIAGFHRLVNFIVRNFHPDKRIRIVKALAAIRPSLIAFSESLTGQDLVFMELSVQRKLYEYVDYFKAIGTPSIITRRDGAVIAANREFTIVTGWKEEVLLGSEENRNVNMGGGLEGTMASGSSQWTRSFDAGVASASSSAGAAGTAGAATTGGAGGEAGKELQPVLIAELMDQDSVAEFYEDYAKLAFNDAAAHACRRGRLLEYRIKEDVLNDEASPEKGESGWVKEGVIDCMYIWDVRRDIFDVPMLIVMNFLIIM